MTFLHVEFYREVEIMNTNGNALKCYDNFEIRQSGMVFTRVEVVNFILDLVGYVPDKPLWDFQILEPASGGGSFLAPIIKRLLLSWKTLSQEKNPLTLCKAIRAVEIDTDMYYSTRDQILELLSIEGITGRDSLTLVENWLLCGDFLLTEFVNKFDFVIGNPPYVRQELIPNNLLANYRRKYHTMYDRSDLYVPFIENSLKLLNDKGKMGFICADRWMKNRYGGPLRGYVSEYFNLDTYVDMVGMDAFQEEVSAYPAVVVLSRNASGITKVAKCPAIESKALKSLVAELVTGSAATGKKSLSHKIYNLADGDKPWLIESPENLTLIRRIENECPPLEQAGCRVGIGVATGADKVFVIDYELLNIEPDRKIPLVTTKDILTGKIKWHGKGVINPFSDTKDAVLVDLENYPLLKQHLENHKEALTRRHCAKSAPINWYRTIDRINPELIYQPKLLIPDIKERANVVYDEGNFYPHHNLYYVLSDEWDLRALQAVFLSDITRLFIKTYSTEMRGGYLRFQAQYLRRVCIPKWNDVNSDLRKELIAAALTNDIAACNLASMKLYDLSEQELGSLTRDG
jgi:hypothetical protein